MEHHRTTNRLQIWPVVFPEEKLIVKRPCLRYICRGNTRLGELLSYFLYEAGHEARVQNVDPLTIHTITIYRVHDEILATIDNSVSEKVLIRMIRELERLGFLRVFSRRCHYSIFLENIRRALALYEKNHPGRPTFSRKSVPNSIISLPTTNDCVPSSEVVLLQLEVVKVQSEVVKVQSEVVEPTVFYIGSTTSSQATSEGCENGPRYKRDKKEEKRVISGEADAIATPPSSLFASSSIEQKPLSPQKVVQDGDTFGEMAAKLQNKQNIADKIDNKNIDENGPEKPDCTEQATVEALMALADYYRGYQLPHSKKPNSQYRMALEAAITLVSRKKTLAEVDAVFAYMLGVNRAFCDDWWPMQTVDLWHVARHFDSMMRKIVHRRAYRTIASAITQPERGDTMVELMEMSLDERRAYLSQVREQMQKECVQK